MLRLCRKQSILYTSMGSPFNLAIKTNVGTVQILLRSIQKIYKNAHKVTSNNSINKMIKKYNSNIHELPNIHPRELKAMLLFQYKLHNNNQSKSLRTLHSIAKAPVEAIRDAIHKSLAWGDDQEFALKRRARQIKRNAEILVKLNNDTGENEVDETTSDSNEKMKEYLSSSSEDDDDDYNSEDDDDHINNIPSIKKSFLPWEYLNNEKNNNEQQDCFTSSSSSSSSSGSSGGGDQRRRTVKNVLPWLVEIRSAGGYSFNICSRQLPKELIKFTNWSSISVRQNGRWHVPDGIALSSLRASTDGGTDDEYSNSSSSSSSTVFIPIQKGMPVPVMSVWKRANLMNIYQTSYKLT